jgi:Fe-S-cluster containining protein
MSDNPCLTCGACCAHFRVSFYWAEADDAPGGHVPAGLTEQVNAHLRCMAGTQDKSPRCAALSGQVGKQVACTIYGQRPSPCREFDVFEADGMPNQRCQRVREALELESLPDAD